MRDKYTRFIQLQNKGAQELGFKDMGAMWRSRYDMPPAEFEAELERLWNQVRPLYESLHAYVRTRIQEQYGAQAVTEEGMIRADLLGNPWAQEWSNIYPLVSGGGGRPGYDLTAILKEKKIDELKMVRYGEDFFKSLGFARCLRPSGSAHCLSNLATVKSYATPAPGTWTSKTTSG